jgi:hypothetical protein
MNISPMSCGSPLKTSALLSFERPTYEPEQPISSAVTDPLWLPSE